VPTSDNKPPFRADHVGSLIRPQRLLDARQKRDQGRVDPSALRAIEAFSSSSLRLGLPCWRA